ncbi:jerky protein homolog-like [Leptopilina boulardi]|uniref:jerky protein homolog-like n=1 Tax=Leptopilina boulardi TaxID=63433 RepID=UPI0021F53908|nr:jerky protein homolog-like [Leptopilina boulardi]
MSEKSQKYKWLSLEDRQEILESFKLHEEKGIKINYAEIARKYNVTRSTIFRMRNISRLQLDNTVHEKRKKMSKISILEDVLYEWFKQKRVAGQMITSPILQEKALLINKEMDADPEFKASKGWLTNFKNRYNIRSITMQGEQLSADFESSVEFVDDLALVMREEKFELHQVYNADETGLFWKMMPRATFVTEYENKAEGSKISKERVTVMVCANADGSHKIPLFVIGKSKKPRCFKGFISSSKCNFSYSTYGSGNYS